MVKLYINGEIIEDLEFDIDNLFISTEDIDRYNKEKIIENRKDKIKKIFG